MTLSPDPLTALRTLLKEQQSDGFLIPRTDAYQGEYLAPGDERLAWLTGFTGSAGLAIVLKWKAALFVDGRYTLQAQNQVNRQLYEICPLTESSPSAWIRKNIEKDQILSYDPWLHTVKEYSRLEKACKTAGASFLAISHNPVDQLWHNRPSLPSNILYSHNILYAGISSQTKRNEIAKKIKDEGAEAALLTTCDSIAWLLNTRGNDIPHTPIAQAFAFIWLDETIDLFIRQTSQSFEIQNHLGNGVRIHALANLQSWMKQLKNKIILIDPANTSIALAQNLEGCSLLQGVDPCLLPKAIKNPAEIAGARQAHLQDGVAVTRFLAWLSQAALTGNLTEMEAAEKLLSFRKENALCVDVSFETISAAGSNGAIVHYRVTPETNCRIKPNSLYLIDSGGQYLHGTTDVTRTVTFGSPTLEQKDRFTRVLKGHIALASALFPSGTSGSQLDVLARQYLWQAGLDYDHGTGHGVGSYLSVHEGPQRISKAPSTVALQEGMIISNEPGYYKTGAYGIRIESLVIVISKGIPDEGERPLLGFETLTLAPIDITLIEVSMLTLEERDWLNEYHKRVYEALSPFLNPYETDWLGKVTHNI